MLAPFSFCFCFANLVLRIGTSLAILFTYALRQGKKKKANEKRGFLF